MTFRDSNTMIPLTLYVLNEFSDVSDPTFHIRIIPLLVPELATFLSEQTIST
jgi:hypothetical protein